MLVSLAGFVPRRGYRRSVLETAAAKTPPRPPATSPHSRTPATAPAAAAGDTLDFGHSSAACRGRDQSRSGRTRRLARDGPAPTADHGRPRHRSEAGRTHAAAPAVPPPTGQLLRPHATPESRGRDLPDRVGPRLRHHPVAGAAARGALLRRHAGVQPVPREEPRALHPGAPVLGHAPDPQAALLHRPRRDHARPPPRPAL